MDPGVNQNWLYTGRGLSVNDIPRLANWMIVVREDYGTQTFWRLYIRTNVQNGSQGLPLHNYFWDFNARYSGSNLDYENGGAISNSIPEGYWIDFTELAAAFGWERFPAQSHWQYSESAARYQYFAFRQGLSLQSALLELYSPQAIQTLTNSANP
jgi:TolB protein